ncbi:helicase-related protein [Ancylomarina longa]|uniref:ATP-dependent helicase n=1 Tax=Ancylomarina longa TaxID=2487017 RepID=A0A434AVN5_9BACT|nr:helicase-related protein [Ancylomarina longa]RUT78424.1 ATP-dependent helicase [Ancylomarina longa]
METKIFDNISNLWGEDLKLNIKKGSKVQIAASCFSIYAYEELKTQLEQVDSLEFIFTTSATLNDKVSEKLKKDSRQYHIPKDNLNDIYGSEFEIELRNKLKQKAIALECAEWIKRKVTFKTNVENVPMQQLVNLRQNGQSTTYFPIQGFTTADMGYQRNNAVSNFINRFDAPLTNAYFQLFDQVWNDEKCLKDITEGIRRNIAEIYQENSPERIYFFMLFNIFKEFLEDINEDVLPNDMTGYKNSVVWNKLFNFQEDGATGIINKLESYNGCILADSVGLGKTFTALAVIKYYELRNKSVLVLCPKKLADNWQTYKSNYKTNILAEDRLNYDLLFHTDLSREKGFSGDIDLAKINWGNYDLIVIDESHNFRNSGRNLKDKETRYEHLMNNIIKTGVKTKVLMLSATPVNNRFSDLKSQLALAYEDESQVLQDKLGMNKTIESVFKQAQRAFDNWSKLPPEARTAKAILDALDFDFFKLLDSVTIARSRKHIEKYYDTSSVGKFPTRRKPLSFRPSLTSRNDVLDINDIYKHLSAVKQAVYAPLSYVFDSRKDKYEDAYGTDTKGARLKQVDREKALQKLMTTNLLKRLESSVEAFRITLSNMNKRIFQALDNIDRHLKSNQNFLAEEFNDSDETIVEDNEDFDNASIFTEGKVQIDFNDIDLVSWKADLDADIALIQILVKEMNKIKPEQDTKLQHIKELIKEKANQPINQGNKKVLIFTAFADTAEYLYSQLAEPLKEKGLELGKLTGSATPKCTLGQGFDFQKLLTFFSPRSKEKSILYPDDNRELDVLIGTDCISEGQNLQDCDYLINYDIHWNPVRIIQRFGRVDRIGSQNDEIQLVNYWPDISLDEYINLKERVENRMHIVDVTATGDDNVLSAKANDVSYRKEQLRRLQDEVIELEDLKTGVNITDLGLNDFRMDLLSYIKDHGDLECMPKGLHAVVPANEELGLKPGVIFTLLNRNAKIKTNKHNHIQPFYLVYIGDDGNVICNYTEVKNLLDITRNCSKGFDKPIQKVCDAFNKETQDGRDMEFYSDLLDKTIYSMLDKQEEQQESDLFSDTQASSFSDDFNGLSDFELISFIVVKENYA